ncbi:uncharacterized protein LOC115883181 isoform X1 [Sitophilus oryzae]|uniref:Uncharacterized protein LOC115883181 isoform X1 n=1 Tax=Sitophilus oryzae TaxID=7048 RepID=A0A6J2Y0S8_SITOR|nr:uncharacterized protein LOC115883181 isoform X1 [Sitophilus oryzae]
MVDVSSDEVRNSSSETSQDAERQMTVAINEPTNDINDSFLGEKIKERVPPGLNGSLVFLYAIFFSEFAIGWVNLNRCSVNRLIPIYLIVAGFLGAAAKHISRYRQNQYCFWAMSFLILVNVAVHCLGTYIVYKEYQPNYDPRNGLYCNRTTYLVAFWILTIEYTLMVLFVFLSICFLLMRNAFHKNT